MGQKKTKKGKTRLDKYYYLAKEQGYRSRASFKLVQLNKKYDFLSSAKSLLDLCAAPGSWLQVASKFMPVSSLIVGVDLVPIRPIPRCTTIEGDITTQKCRADIKKAFAGWKADVVLHDGAPNVGQSWMQDAYTQSELVLAALKLATEFLREGGHFVTKIFRSSDYNSLIWVFNQLFKKVEATKPQASRNTSAEIFVVCQGYLEPKKIDSKLLDPKFVFKEVDEPANLPDVFSKQSSRPPRIGYEDGKVLLFKKASIIEFLDDPQPIALLAKYNQFVFDDDAKVFKTHKLTTTEILEICKDLKVHGKGDLKYLLKWRSEMIKFREKELGVPNGSESQEEDDTSPSLTVEEQEELLSKELDEKIGTLNQKKKREKRKAAEKHNKQQKKIDMKMILPGDVITAEEMDLFNLANIKGDEELDAIEEDDDPDVFEDDESQEYEQEDDDDEIEYSDIEGEELAYLNKVDNMLEDSYSEKVEKNLTRTEKAKVAKKSKKQQKEAEEELDNDDIELTDLRPNGDENFVPKVSGDVFSSEDEKSNSLIVKPKIPKPSLSKRAERWFGRDLFDNIEDEGDEQNDEEPDEEIIEVAKKRYQQKLIQNKVKEEEESDDSSDEEKTPAKRAKKRKRNNGSDDEDEQNGFEEVPAVNDMDEDQRVQALALGTLMVNNKELKREMMDNAYNRYAFNDGALPSWFLDDEEKHNKPQLPITKDMVAEIKRKTMEINARPIKKVAEAKARKKMKTDKKMEQIKAKAQSIADSADLTPAEKNKQIERLYKKEKKKPRAKEKAYVVTKKSQKGKLQLAGLRQKGKRLKAVDPRMKKDHLKNKAKEKGKGGGGGKSNKPSNRKEGSKERKHRKSLHPQSATPDRGTKRKR